MFSANLHKVIIFFIKHKPSHAIVLTACAVLYCGQNPLFMVYSIKCAFCKSRFIISHVVYLCQQHRLIEIDLL